MMLNVKAMLIAAPVAAIVVTGWAAVSVSVVLAQGPPSTQPATQTANIGTPMDTLRAFIETYKRYDAGAIREMFFATDERARRMVDAMCAYMQAAHDVRIALVDQFGPDTLEELPELNSITPLDYLTQIDDDMLAHFEEKIEQNEAILSDPEKKSDDFILIRTNTGWKISADRMTDTWTAEQTDERTATVKLSADAVELLRKKIAAGSVTSIDEVRFEIERLPGYGR